MRCRDPIKKKPGVAAASIGCSEQGCRALAHVRPRYEARGLHDPDRHAAQRPTQRMSCIPVATVRAHLQACLHAVSGYPFEWQHQPFSQTNGSNDEFSVFGSQRARQAERYLKTRRQVGNIALDQRLPRGEEGNGFGIGLA